MLKKALPTQILLEMCNTTHSDVLCLQTEYVFQHRSNNLPSSSHSLQSITFDDASVIERQFIALTTNFWRFFPKFRRIVEKAREVSILRA